MSCQATKDMEGMWMFMTKGEKPVWEAHAWSKSNRVAFWKMQEGGQ